MIRIPRVLAAAVFLSTPVVASAQMPTPLLSLAERDWTPENTCANAPAACQGQTWDTEFGMKEFVLSRVVLWEKPLEIVEIRLDWPSGWSFLGWESCSGTLISGDPSIPGTPLRFSFESCVPEETFLRVWMDCPVPGTFRATPIELLSCGGYAVEENLGLYVDIGDWCGARPHGHCTPCAYENAAGYFVPSSVDVLLDWGTIWADTLEVSGLYGQCAGIPECCPPFGSGFMGIYAEPSWIEVTLLKEDFPEKGYQTFPYQVVVRGDQLEPGIHSGKIWAAEGCCTRANCIPVTATVLGTADVPEVDSPTTLLGEPHPNPTDGSIRFAINLPEPGRVRVSVVDAGGRLVAVVLNRELPAGRSLEQWRPSQELRGRIASGVYFLELESLSGRQSRTFVVR